MAYKTFANGFPLPASDLNNFLMNQSVIVFADSAARGTAIPSPVQGMLTYLEDTSAYESWNGSAYVDLNDNTDAIPKSTVTTSQDLIVADGASSVTRLGVGTNDQVLSVVAGSVAWADAGGGGGSMTLISTTTMSGATVVLSSIPQTYKALRLEIKGHYFTGNGDMNIRINGLTTSVYVTVDVLTVDNTNFNSSRINVAPYNGTSSRNSLVIIDLPNYTDTTIWKFVKSAAITNEQTNNSRINLSQTVGITNQSSAITSLTFFSDSVNFSGGEVKLFGVN